MPPGLCSLPRFPLSVILAYLQQPLDQNRGNSNSGNPVPPLPHNRDALSLLITTKRFAYAILPLFHVPRQRCRNYQYQTKDGTHVMVVERFRFITLPIQDPRTLLDRLNTRRLRGRIALMNQMKKEERSLQTCDEGETEGELEVDCDRLQISEDGKKAHNLHQLCYQRGRTVEELAYEEWAMMRIDHTNKSDDDRNCKSKQWKLWPAQLELLRFLDGCGDEIMQEQSTSSNGNKQKERRDIPSPFCFRPSRKIRHKGAKETTIADNNMMDDRVFGDGVSLLVSYPRSGNTLLRTLMERITSIVTGSDTRPDRTLSRSLAMDHDLVGEGLVGPIEMAKTKSKSLAHVQNLYQSVYDPVVHIVKTHFPERKGWKPVKGSRVLLLVRNPYDAIDSYWNLCCTNTHTRTLEESVYAKYAKKFEGLARHEIKVWCDFHHYWIDVCEEEGVPLLVVRYEDLVLDVEAEMLRVIKFLTDQRGVVDRKLTSFWKWRIQHAVGKSRRKKGTEQSTSKQRGTNESSQTSTSTSSLGSYQPRSSAGGLLSIGKSIRKGRYSDTVLQHMHEVAVSLALSRKQYSNSPFQVIASERTQSNSITILQQFGYDVYTQKFPENFKNPPSLPMYGSGRQNGTVMINNAPEIRAEGDPYGRAMTFWRRGETDGDANPFPTVPR